MRSIKFIIIIFLNSCHAMRKYLFCGGEISMFYSLNERKATTFDRHSKKSLGIETSFGLISSKNSDNIQLRKPPAIQNLAALQLCQKEVHHFSANHKTYFIPYFPIKSNDGENSFIILTYWKFVDNKILSAFRIRAFCFFIVVN